MPKVLSSLRGVLIPLLAVAILMLGVAAVTHSSPVSTGSYGQHTITIHQAGGATTGEFVFRGDYPPGFLPEPAPAPCQRCDFNFPDPQPVPVPPCGHRTC